MTEDDMVGWHHLLNGHKFEKTPGIADGQGGLACSRSWCCKESDTTEQLTELNSPMELQYSCLGNSMDRGAWQTTVRGVRKALGMI